MDLGVLPAFVVVIVLFLLPPGPDMTYMLAVGLQGGRAAAVQAILGIGTGMGVYALAVVLGVAEVASSYPLVLEVVKVCGAAYLLWLGSVTIRKGRETGASPATTATGRPYWRGVAVSLTNVKVLLFFLAVLPQFLGDARSTAWQLAMLGVVNIAMEVTLYGAIGVLAGTFHARFARSGRANAALTYLAGVVYLALAAVVVADLLTTHTSG